MNMSTWARRLRALIMILSITTGSTFSLAQIQEPTSSLAQRRHQAKQRFIRGLSLVERGKWDGALAEFLASRELYATHVALENAAICLRKLGRKAEALAMYEQVLRDFGTNLSPDDRAATIESIAKLKSEVGRVLVTTSPAGCSVVIDGQQRAETPLSEPILIDAGTHTIRVSKEGYGAFQKQIRVSGGRAIRLRAELMALQHSGTLVVREERGRRLDVVVDGAVVGTTPIWRGRVAAGARGVLLQGAHQLGTAPARADVRPNQTTTLTLRAVLLDSEIYIEPSPENATVFVDGVEVGAGVWQGRLPAGSHRIETAALGYVPYRDTVTLRRHRRTVLDVSLEKDLSSPIWERGFARHFYVEPMLGLFWAPTLGGSADAACAQGSCSQRSRPLGWMGGGRLGYQLTSRLGVELFLGFLAARESTTRTVTANAEGRSFSASDYADQSVIAGAVSGASASYRFFESTPLTLRAWAGVGRVVGSFENRGTFSGSVANPNDPSDIVAFTQRVSVPEQNQHVWLPFFGPEVRFGLALGKRTSVDVGIAAFLMFAPATPRSGSNDLSSNQGDGARKAPLDEVQGGFGDGSDVRPGVLSLPKEAAFGTFVSIVPSVAARFDL